MRETSGTFLRAISSIPRILHSVVHTTPGTVNLRYFVQSTFGTVVKLFGIVVKLLV